MIRSFAVGLLSVCGSARAVTAQDARLTARLGHATAQAVNAVVDSARRERLPTSPLVDKALEGAAKGSTGLKIVSAVRTLRARLDTARLVLGSEASNAEIEAAAGALDAGASPADIARLRAVARKRRVTVPLAVLTDLIGRDVPVATAVNTVVSLAKAGVHDTDFAIFQRNVRLDIENGADPGTAASTRATGTALRAGAHPSHTS